MKIIVKYSEGTAPYYDNESPCHTTVVSNTGTTLSVSFGAGEAEDMILSRDLSDAFNIRNLLELAYQCGKQGEEIKIIEQEYED